DGDALGFFFAGLVLGQGGGFLPGVAADGEGLALLLARVGVGLPVLVRDRADDHEPADGHGEHEVEHHKDLANAGHDRSPSRGSPSRRLYRDPVWSAPHALVWSENEGGNMPTPSRLVKRK